MAVWSVCTFDFAFRSVYNSGQLLYQKCKWFLGFSHQITSSAFHLRCRKCSGDILKCTSPFNGPEVLCLCTIYTSLMRTGHLNFHFTGRTSITWLDIGHYRGLRHTKLYISVLPLSPLLFFFSSTTIPHGVLRRAPRYSSQLGLPPVEEHWI